MKIAVILNAHGNTELVQDTLEAIHTWVGSKVVVLIDGATWNSWGRDANLSAYKLEGFYHNCPRSPYRNVTLGLMKAAEFWPDVDWYCYTEYDTLFVSDEFKNYLEEASKLGVWCIGNDARDEKFQFPLVEQMLGKKLKQSKYLLGCCVFHKAEFLHKLQELNFFDRFLNLTNAFNQGFFPDYEKQGGYDIAEHLYPTLAHHLGGKVAQFACWNPKFPGSSEGHWTGSYDKFQMRWQPDLEFSQELIGASILHPIKDLDNPIRSYFKQHREKLWKNCRVKR